MSIQLFHMHHSLLQPVGKIQTVSKKRKMIHLTSSKKKGEKEV